MRITTAITAAGAMLLAAGCGADTPAASPPAPPMSATASTDGLGSIYNFAKAEDGTKIGSIRFLETVEVPTSCLFDPLPAGAQGIAVRAELTNVGALAINRPDSDVVRVNDSEGFTQPTRLLSIRGECRISPFPDLASAPAPGKASGWFVVQSPVKDPAALVYTPLVWSETASISNWDAVRVDPTHVVVPLKPIPAAQSAPAPAPSVATTVAPPAAPTIQIAPKPAAAAAGQSCDPDVDNWAKDASGGQLKCAYAGGSTPKWVRSAPLVGTRTPGTSCELGSAVAESPAGETLVCVGEQGSATWTPGP